MALIDKPERARQLARAIASDLTLYHEAKILQRHREGHLFDVVRDGSKRAGCCSKPGHAGDHALNQYERALVDG
jgi:hypothetical protein